MLKSIVAGVVFGTFGFLGTAEASVVTVSYFGQIQGDGYDESNFFGAGTALSGQFLTLNYVFDTGKGAHVSSGGLDEVIGGGPFGQQSPALSASVTINGKTISFAGADGGYLNASRDSSESRLGQSAQYDVNNYVSSIARATPGSLPNSIASPLSIALGGAGEPTALGSFSFYNADYNVSGSFDGRSLTISAVPLPSALPMFGLALVGLGTAAAFRKRLSQRASQ